MNGYLKPGDFRGRRGRFWIPLIALFHGLRCNEVAQLYTEDIEEEDGVPFFYIRAERADGSKCDKILKTNQSKRPVPIHSELIRLGFLKFVEERRQDSTHPRLFAELEIGKDGYFSDPFSKWFARFKTGVLGSDCKATFHSFRHMFRDALSDAGVSVRDAERLGGWFVGSRSAEADYGRGPSLGYLQRQIEKVRYEGLDLSHLGADFCNRLQNLPQRPRHFVRKRRMGRIR
jgi:integrase